MDAPVIVVGAGPTGLTLAAELRLGGADAIVIDKLTEPSGQSRGLGFTARTVEMFDQRGLLPLFGEIETSTLGHFAGLPLDYSVLPGAHFGARGIPQARIEAVLAAWAAGHGVPVRRGWTAVALDDRGDGVDVDVETPRGPRRLRGRYVVGCDGGHSFVRRAAGFDFPGTDASIEMFLADVAGCDLRVRRIGERRPGGMVMSAPLGDGVDRIIVVERGTPPRRRTAPPRFAEVADAWQRLTGEDIHGGTPLWVSTFTDATRQVTQYRKGSVLVAGDAAHTHLPAGGQGLSIGVQDSMNLGWKLAATVRGWAPAGLLDSYHAERHPVGARVVTNTQAQGYLYQSGAEVDPLRDVFADLMAYPDVGRHLAGMVSGLDIRYDVGPGEHPLAGRRVPDAELATATGRTRVPELLHRARGVLLDLAGAGALVRAADAWRDRVDVVSARPDGGPLAGTAALLIRPDGYVAWANPDGAPDPETQTLQGALRRWFGSPCPPA
jgi:bifunctional hydroxylase/dehydrase